MSGSPSNTTRLDVKFNPEDSTTWPKVLVVGEVKRVLRCHVDSVYALIDSGKLRSVSIGKNGKRVPRIALLEYLGEVA